MTVWRCYVKMWRCENVWQTPTIRRTLRSDALGKKQTKLQNLSLDPKSQLGTVTTARHKSSNTVPVPVGFLQHSSKIPARFQDCTVPARFQHGSRKVPARFQDCSGFSGCAFSCRHSPAPEIETQQVRCWEFCFREDDTNIALAC